MLTGTTIKEGRQLVVSLVRSAWISAVSSTRALERTRSLLLNDKSTLKRGLCRILKEQTRFPYGKMAGLVIKESLVGMGTNGGAYGQSGVAVVTLGESC